MNIDVGKKRREREQNRKYVKEKWGKGQGKKGVKDFNSKLRVFVLLKFHSALVAK